MNSQFSQGYGSPHGYIPTRTQHGYRQSRALSSPSQSQEQPFQAQNFPRPIGNLEDADQYSFDQPTGWDEENAVLPELPSAVTSDFSIEQLRREIQNHATSEREDPWNLAVGFQGRGPDNRFSFTFPTPPTGLTKAATVAGRAEPSDRQFKRPSLGPRTSFVSAADSGYYSQSQHGNLISPTHVERKDIVFTQIPPTSEAPPPPASVKTDPTPRGSQKKRRKSKSFNAKCQICDKELKNPSDAHKHSLQHSKPYHCDIHICRKKDGFATVNDLERHRKSVHKVEPRVGKTTVYFCQACTQTPGSEPKDWPRLDNFKAHIRRKHSNLNMDELIQRSEREVERRPESEYGHSSHPPLSSIPQDDLSYQQEWPSANDNAMSRHPSQHPDFNTILGFDNQVAHVGGMGDYQVNNMSATGVQYHGPQYPTDGMMMLHQAAAYQQMISPVDSMNLSPSTHLRHSVPNICLNGQTYLENDEMDMDSRSTKRMKMVNTSPSVSQDTVSSVHAEGEHRCEVCGKLKRRECDLRKHMKRHTRPYGCTFAKCYKRFGSRNDWKRHENSQHFLSEMWRCHLPRSNGHACGHLAHEKHQFATHLFDAHKIPPGSEKSNTTCREMHLGREGHHHFWCGFCNNLIRQAEGIQPWAWDVRFKHIGDHFDKEGLSIDDWIDIEKNRKKKLIDSEENSRKASTNSRIDDDSDLGEDGIPPVPVVYSGVHTRQPTIRRKAMNEEVDADGVSDDDWPC